MREWYHDRVPGTMESWSCRHIYKTIARYELTWFQIDFLEGLRSHRPKFQQEGRTAVKNRLGPYTSHEQLPLLQEMHILIERGRWMWLDIDWYTSQQTFGNSTRYLTFQSATIQTEYIDRLRIRVYFRRCLIIGIFKCFQNFFVVGSRLGHLFYPLEGGHSWIKQRHDAGVPVVHSSLITE